MTRLAELCDRLVADGSRTLAEPAAGARAARRWLEVGHPVDERTLAEAFVPLFERRSPARPLPAEVAFLAYRESVRERRMAPARVASPRSWPSRASSRRARGG